MKILIVCQGKCKVLQWSVQAAKAASLNNEVIVIGSPDNDLGLCEFVLEDFSDNDMKRLDNSYVHKSPNPHEFELFCLKRWFAIRNYACKINEPVFVMDSDVMVFCDIGQKNNISCDFSVSDSGIKWGIAQHIAYWNNLRSLEEFCKLILEVYENPSSDSAKRVFERGGCVCDMTFSCIFSKDSRYKVRNTLDLIDHSIFDHNMDMISQSQIEDLYKGQAYQTSDPFNYFLWRNKCPYYLKNGGEIIFNTLHCSRYKDLMPRFYKEMIK